ncbi:MAG: hypothetical protein JWR23_1114 [Mucilaginibacter sp.]|nr:hypothetical protein [Mucilaginibacter sp.]
MTQLFSRQRLFYGKAVLLTVAVFFLLFKSEQHFYYPVLILLLLCCGYYLGKITCSVHLQNTSIGITLFVFIVMNLIHSFIDGISFNGQPFFYWLTAVGGHELIRQPTLYIILWAMLQPASISGFLKALICILSITIAWLIGIWLGKISGATVSHLYPIGEWTGYSIFIFIGDIVHHLIDQYRQVKHKR